MSDKMYKRALVFFKDNCVKCSNKECVDAEVEFLYQIYSKFYRRNYK